ncbi:MAG: MoaD/ThiS family protein [Candidatus Rokubacteria bacterium]|nr:MoaD/ThiS family protein [Candidatus Rokubacteria bacterium]
MSLTRTATATIEVTTWVTRLAGGDGSGTRRFDEPLEPGDTVRAILARFTRRFPELDAALWSPSRRELGEHIEVLVNDAVLGVAYDLETPLLGGERITLLGQFMGGAQGGDKGPSASLAPSAGRSTYREYASRPAVGRRLAAGPLSPPWAARGQREGQVAGRRAGPCTSRRVQGSNPLSRLSFWLRLRHRA